MWRLTLLGLALTTIAVSWSTACSLRSVDDLQRPAPDFATVASTAATGGAAGSDGCGANLGDCDGAAGCETDLSMSASDCGACAHDCEGGACEEGRCQPMVLARTPVGKGIPTTVAYGGGNVYFPDATRTIYAVPASATTETAAAIVSIDTGLIWDIAVDAPRDRIYWASDTGASTSPLPMGFPVTMRPGNAFSVALLGAVQYFLTADGIWLAPNDLLIGPQVTFGSVDVTSAGLVVFSDTASLVGSIGPLLTCNMPGLGGVYFVDSQLIAREIAAMQNCVISLAVDDGAVYWTDSGDGSVWSAPLAIQPPKLRLDPRPQEQPFGIAVDAERVYWVSTGAMPLSGELWSVRKDGSEPELLLSGLASPLFLAIDAADNRLFFTSADVADRSVMKLVLPAL